MKRVVAPFLRCMNFVVLESKDHGRCNPGRLFPLAVDRKVSRCDSVAKRCKRVLLRCNEKPLEACARIRKARTRKTDVLNIMTTSFVQ